MLRIKPYDKSYFSSFWLHFSEIFWEFFWLDQYQRIFCPCFKSNWMRLWLLYREKSFFSREKRSKDAKREIIFATCVVNLFGIIPEMLINYTEKKGILYNWIKYVSSKFKNSKFSPKKFKIFRENLENLITGNLFLN